MNINLKLQGEELKDETLQNLTKQMYQSINQETGFDASLQKTETRVGSRGDSTTVGEIALAILGSGGAVVALIGVFKSFIERTKELSIKMKNQSGEALEITSKNIDSAEIKSMIDKFFIKE